MKLNEVLTESVKGLITKRHVESYFKKMDLNDKKNWSRWGQWESFMEDKWIRKPSKWSADMKILHRNAFKMFDDVYRQMHRYKAEEVFGEVPPEDSSPVQQNFSKDFVKGFKGQYFVLEMPDRSYIVDREGTNYIRYFIPLR